MKKITSIVVSAALTVSMLLNAVQKVTIHADNPLAQNVYTADPAPMVHDGTLYLYTSHDKDGSDYFYMPDWQCYSTTDMQNWTHHGTVLSDTDFSYAEKDTAWAAQCVERNGKFYMYCPLSNAEGGGRVIGVAVSDSPTGPFKDAIGKPLLGPNWDYIDPTVFIDDDGQAYLYFGNPQLYYVKLNEDMISYSGEIQKVDMSQGFGVSSDPDSRTGALYTEGPWFYKRGNLYYMLYAAEGIPENISYSISSSPTGPWTYKGVIMPKGEDGSAFTNHCGVIDYKGHSYFFYHNQRLPGGGGFTRSAAVEEFSYNSDGSFPVIRMSNDGPEQLEALDPYVRNEAEKICFEVGIETESCSNGGMNVANIENGDYIKVSGVDFGTGAESFTASVASATNGGKIEIHLDSIDGPLAGTLDVPGTDGWQNWVEVSCDISGTEGKHDVYFKYIGGDGYLFNVDWWKFKKNNAETSTVSNPIIWSDVPDLDVIRVGDTYYMVSTTMFFNPGAPIMKSKDLVSWKICNYVYDVLADGDVQNLKNGKNDYGHGQWASSLRYHNGTYYVFFGSYGTGKSYIYKTNDIEHGTWTKTELNGMYHDASLFFDDDGRNYLIYGAGGTIRVKELNSEMTGFKEGGADKELFSTGLDGLSGEGAHIQKIGDYYYIFLIAWPSNSGRIELCYRSKDILGNYEGRTILDSEGAAQGGIIDTPDGKWYGLVFKDHGAVGRVPVLVPVTWQNDWPIMGINGKVPATIEINGRYNGTFLATADDFSYDSNKLALEWQWNHNPDNTAWSVTERKGYLRLRNKSLATNILDAKNTLTQRTEGPFCSSIIKLDASNMKAGDYAGLSAFQYKYGNVGVYIADDGSKKIYMAENGIASSGGEISESYNKIIEEVDMTGNEIYLKVDFKFNDVNESNISYNIDKANFYYSYDGSNWINIGNELSMSYDLKLFTGYRSAIYSYATKTIGGYADIDFFDYERAEWNQPEEIKPNSLGWYFSNGFENDTEDWTGRGTANVASSANTGYVGNNSLFVSGRTSSWNGAQKALSDRVFKPGNEYSFSVNVKFDSEKITDKFFMKLEYSDANGKKQYALIAEGIAVKGEWMQLSNPNFKIPLDAEDMYLYIETYDGNNNFYIDEAIGAVGGTGILGAGVQKFILGDINFDGVVDAYDMILARRGCLSSFDSTLAQAAADVDQNGVYDKADLVLIQDFILGRIKEFPVA